MNLDFLGATLFISAVVSLLVSISLIGNFYQWKDWQVLSAVALGTTCSVLFLLRELFPCLAWLHWRKADPTFVPLLGLTLFKGVHAMVTFMGAIFLGFIVRLWGRFPCEST
jgi:hypothetical protein